MTHDDVPVAERLCADAFYEADLSAAPRGAPEPPRRSPEDSQDWIRRTERFLTTDPRGCWVAANDGGLLGFATSTVRDRLWILVTFAVRLGLQGQGIGRQLLARAEGYGTHCDRSMLTASNDQAALRLYHASGFALYPQMLFEGEVDRSALPAAAGLREGKPDDVEWMDALDRDLRGAPHGPDHASLANMRRLIVTTDRTGYAYASEATVDLLAARDPDAATRLLWECLAGAAAAFSVPHVTSANMWAANVALRARLAMRTRGFLGVRAMAPPSPYIHSGPHL